MEAKDRIIVALDVDSPGKAKALVEQLAPRVGLFKLGLEFITSTFASLLDRNGMNAMQAYSDAVALFELLDGKVFWDGKFHDIPNTMAGASKAVTKLGVKMFNIHASAGNEAMTAAVDASGNALVLAVTVLTSLEENNAHLIFGKPVKAAVLQFARDANTAGCDGIICSPQELEFLGKQKELGDLIKVTPGVRPEWAAVGDQKRVMTPGEAIKAGADYLVIGRPITNPPSEIGGPVEAAQRIAEEIQEALITKIAGQIAKEAR